jgi:hypothetical protein
MKQKVLWKLHFDLPAVERRKKRTDRNKGSVRIRMLQAQPIKMLLSAHQINIEIEGCPRENS